MDAPLDHYALWAGLLGGLDQSGVPYVSLNGPAGDNGISVNVDDADLRRNRLRLLAHIQQVMDNVADFSKIEG